MIQHSTFLGISLRTLAHRRGLVLAYYAIALLFVVPLLVFGKGRLMPMVLIMQTVTLGGVFGGVRAGGVVKSYNETPNPGEESPVLTLDLSSKAGAARPSHLDERERMARDHAHYVAYRILMWSMAGAMVFLCLTLEWTLTFFEQNAPTLLWATLIFAFSLPQSVLLWTEPEPLSEGTLTLVSAKR